MGCSSGGRGPNNMLVPQQGRRDAPPASATGRKSHPGGTRNRYHYHHNAHPRTSTMALQFTSTTSFNMIWLTLLVIIRWSSVATVLQPHLSCWTAEPLSLRSSQGCNTTYFMKITDVFHKNNPLFFPQLYDTSFGRPPQMLYHESPRSPEQHHTWSLWSGANTFGKNAAQYCYGHTAFSPTPGHRYALECKILHSRL